MANISSQNYFLSNLGLERSEHVRRSGYGENNKQIRVASFPFILPDGGEFLNPDGLLMTGEQRRGDGTSFCTAPPILLRVRLLINHALDWSKRARGVYFRK